MGILDSLTNLSPEQTQGLLAFAANTLQNANTGRPMSFGGALGGGIQAYQQNMDAQRKKKIEDEQAAQIAQLTGLKIKDAESDLSNQQALRDRAEGLRKFYMSQAPGAPQQSGGMPAANMGSEVFVNAASSYGLPTDNAGLNKIVDLVNQGMSPTQAAASLAGKNSPTVENSQIMQGAMPSPKSQPAPAQKTTIYEQRLAQAQALRNAGYGPEADAAEAAALKFQPKVKGWEKVQQAGKVMFAPFFEDGTSGAPVPLEVAEKLQFQNTGGKTLGLNPFTGQQVAAFGNTQSPDSIASNAVAIRGQNMTNARGIEANAIARDRASAEKAPTEFQGKSASYGLRATEADKILNGLGTSYNPAAINSKNTVSNWPLIGGIAGAATNYALSDNDQIAEQAQRDFINATLRQESGAAIGKDEFDNARKQYFPQPGDSKAVIANKAINRQLVIQGFDSAAGRAKLTAPERQAAAQPPRKSVIKGQVIDGYKFKGGDPADQNNWEKR